MAKAIVRQTGVAVFLNGFLLVPHHGAKVLEADHRPKELSLKVVCGHSGERTEYAHNDSTNRYVLKFGDDGSAVGMDFTEPVFPEDIISVLDTGKWGLSIVHYEISENERGLREVTFHE